MTIRRMDHVRILLDDLKLLSLFFVELGLEVESEMPVEGRRVDRVVGLDGARVDIAMMRTPDGSRTARYSLARWRSPRMSIALLHPGT
jgi:hypothetical protein